MKLKKILSGVVAGIMVLSAAVTPAFAKVFPDTEEHWAKDAVDVLSGYGVINGDDQGNFRPNDSITRAETATILDNLIGYVTQSNKVFSDVAVDDWFAYSISRLYAAGVMTGYEDGTILPKNNITRQETAVLISRALGFKTEDADTTVLDQFADRDTIGSWAEDAVAFMAERGYIQGSDGNFRATDSITRAETATILNNIVGIYTDGSQTAYSGEFGDKVAIVKNAADFDNITLGGAVISPKASGKIFFGSGAVINGCLYNISSSATVDASRANAMYSENVTIKADSTDSKPSTNTGSTNDRYTGSVSTGGGRGGSSGGSSSSTSSKSFKITFKANGGEFEGGDESVRVTYKDGQKYRTKLPDDPERKGYEFAGWYTTSDGADKLSNSKKVDTSDYVTSTKTLYAGWEGGEGVLSEGLDFAEGSDICGYGKDADELMDDDMEMDIDEDDDELYLVSGTLKYVKEYVDFPGDADEGNFLALSYTLPEDLEYPEKVQIVSRFGGSNTKEIYDDFDEDNLTYTRVFYVTEDDLETLITFNVDFDEEYNEDYDNVSISVNIEDLELDEDKTVTKNVSTEVGFVNALENEDVTDIVITDSFELADSKTYQSEGVEKKIVVKEPLTVAPEATVVLKNLNFKTAYNSSADSLINTAGATAVTLSGVKVEGAFTDVVVIEDDAVVTVENCEFKNTALVGKAINVFGAGEEISITGNTFENYTVAVKSNGIETVSKNKFIENTIDIKAEPAEGMEDIIPSYAYNYFDDEAVIDYVGNFIFEPYYKDETLETLSDNTYDAFVFATSSLAEETETYTLSELEFLALQAEEELTVQVLPRDVRNETVAITGGTPVEETTDTVTVTVPGTSLSVKVGEGEEKAVLIGHTSTEIKVYSSVTEGEFESEITAEELIFSVDSTTLADSEYVYIKITATDETQKITTLKNEELSYTADENGVFEIPVTDITGDTNVELSVESVVSTTGETVEYKVVFINE